MRSNQNAALAALACALTFHAPDGSQLVVLSEAIKAIRPVASWHAGHLANGVHSVIYTGVSSKGFAVNEGVREVLRMMQCSP